MFNDDDCKVIDVNNFYFKHLIKRKNKLKRMAAILCVGWRTK